MDFESTLQSKIISQSVTDSSTMMREREVPCPVPGSVPVSGSGARGGNLVVISFWHSLTFLRDAFF